MALVWLQWQKSLSLDPYISRPKHEQNLNATKAYLKAEHIIKSINCIYQPKILKGFLFKIIFALEKDVFLLIY